jgi:phenylpyruvate tautomerase PptA (4-oxalocrotonate tautomerase family)
LDGDKYINQKHRKLDKHFAITVNGKRVKILKYKIYNQGDKFDKQEVQIIELITKISNENLNIRNKRVSIVIEKVDSIIEVTGLFYAGLFQPGLSRYMFKLESYNEIDKIIGS